MHRNKWYLITYRSKTTIGNIGIKTDGFITNDALVVVLGTPVVITNITKLTKKALEEYFSTKFTGNTIGPIEYSTVIDDIVEMNSSLNQIISGIGDKVASTKKSIELSDGMGTISF